MRLRELGEFGLIDKICKATPKAKGVYLGIGDDAAWVQCKRDSLLITSDVLIEGFHFDLRWTSFHALGYKTLSVNVSDIAAMGGKPLYLTLSLGIPVDFEAGHIEEFYRGMTTLASESGVTLVGGDTSAADRFFISACLIGYAPYGVVSRSGAKVGDDLYVTGSLGDSALGLHLLKRSNGKPKRAASYLIARHRFPTARLRAGIHLAREKLAKAMIDVSDGLLQDLGHICKASGIGAVVWMNALPVSAPYRSFAGRQGLFYALTGGEDYELLFCSRRQHRARLEGIQRRLGIQITRIGTCVSMDEGITVLNGKGKPVSIAPWGYDHFKN